MACDRKGSCRSINSSCNRRKKGVRGASGAIVYKGKLKRKEAIDEGQGAHQFQVLFSPRNPNRKPMEKLRALYGDDYYICRFQEPGVIEAEFLELGTETVIKGALTNRSPDALFLPKGKYFGQPDINLPSWLSEEDVKYYTTKYDKTGFTGGLNYYRNMDLNWELTAPWTGSQVKVAVKYIVGEQDLTYHAPGAKDYIHKGGFKRDVPFLQEVIIIEGAAHFIHEEKPDEIIKHIHDFFQKF